MSRWKEVFWKLLFPNIILIYLLFLVSFVLLIYAFYGDNCPEAVAYISYIVSAYTLTVICARMPNVIKKVKNYLYQNKYTKQYLTEKELRIRISLYGGLVLNICFAIFKVVMGILYQSKWLFATAGYHTILSGMRFLLVYRDQTDKRETNDFEKRLRRLHSYKVCGWLMLLLNSAISVIVLMVVFDNQKIVYPGYMIYAIAAFSFYYMTMAVINMVKFWHRFNPIFSAVKRIELAKAMVSVFTLQVAMLTKFGKEGSLDHRFANGATGISVCVIITIMAILMLTGVKKDYNEVKRASW